jgi:hypothetical protein
MVVNVSPEAHAQRSYGDSCSLQLERFCRNDAPNLIEPGVRRAPESLVDTITCASNREDRVYFPNAQIKHLLET